MPRYFIVTNCLFFFILLAYLCKFPLQVEKIGFGICSCDKQTSEYGLNLILADRSGISPIRELVLLKLMWVTGLADTKFSYDQHPKAQFKTLPFF